VEGVTEKDKKKICHMLMNAFVVESYRNNRLSGYFVTT
jgi:hypothetical protein